MKGHKIEMEADGIQISKTVKMTPERRKQLGMDEEDDSNQLYTRKCA